ncbi:PAS domain S-box protein [Rapidithrix thailandica]|uniref:PAS domain S-box protein n=1 Tax=Rapidithrix thailandica TaxID=413964 RepID=A0AAW9S9K5_9BACT
MFKQIKIGTKITILLLTVVVVSVISVSYLSYIQSRNYIEKTTAGNFKVISDAKVDQIGSFFKELQQNIALVQNSPLAIQSFRKSNFADINEPVLIKEINTDLNSFIPAIQRIYNYNNIVLTNKEGVVFYKSNSTLKVPVLGERYEGYNELLEKGKEELYFGKVFLAGKQAFMYVVSPIKSQYGGVIGYMVLSFNVSENIYKKLNEEDALGESGEIILCKQEESKINIISPLKGVTTGLLTEFVLNNDPTNIAVQKSALGEKPDFIYDIDFRGVTTLSYWNHIPVVDWGLVVKMDKEEVNQPIYDLVWTFVKSSLLIIFLALTAALVYSKLLVRPIIYINDKLNLISKGVLPENIEVRSQDEIGEMGSAVKDLVIALKRTVNFAHQIGEGNYAAEFTPMSKDDNLGNALLSMRDSIQEADERDNKRNWIVTGVAEISQILRLHNDLEGLGNEVIAFVTEKINAIQGAFYTINELDNESEALFEMVACYAYQKKKYYKKDFKFAEGLVGQCAAEQDIILRTEIPEDYVTITSGILGDQKPSCIVLIPLLIDEKVYGILEFAGFTKFSPTHIEFVKEISVIIARTIFNIKVNERTVKLLEESQKMSEELKMQQEILRQNAEEMEATQEELKRTNHRLEEQIEEVNMTQKRMQVFLENASEVIAIYEKNGEIRYISPSVEPILGYSQEEMTGISDLQNIHPDSREVFDEFFSKLLEDVDNPYSIQVEYITKDNHAIWLEATGTNLLSDPAIKGIVVNSRDITERRRAEQEERMRSQMQALSENSPDLITRVNKEGTVYYINPIIENLTGRHPDMILAKPINEIDLDTKIKSSWIALLEQVVDKGQKIEVEMEFPTFDGERVMQVNAIPEFNDLDEVESALIVYHDITERKKAEIEIRDTHKKITESINYSQRIQSAILPDDDVIQRAFPDSFMLYLPRDVVSGDFPWFLEKGDDVYIAAVDCTGHGVPGALISLIGFFILNDVVNSQGVSDVGQILDALNAGVTRTLKQSGDSSDTKDGMDISLCKVNKKQNELEYAGAHRPLYFYSSGELTQIRGDKFPIGGGQYRNRTNFKTNKIEIQKGDEIYMFSDGMPDQFGGPNNRKFAPRRLRELISQQKHSDMQEMKQIVYEEFINWKGDRRQTDDILLIGVKF